MGRENERQITNIVDDEEEEDLDDLNEGYERTLAKYKTYLTPETVRHPSEQDAELSFMQRKHPTREEKEEKIIKNTKLQKSIWKEREIELPDIFRLDLRHPPLPLLSPSPPSHNVNVMNNSCDETNESMALKTIKHVCPALLLPERSPLMKDTGYLFIVHNVTQHTTGYIRHYLSNRECDSEIDKKVKHTILPAPRFSRIGDELVLYMFFIVTNIYRQKKDENDLSSMTFVSFEKIATWTIPDLPSYPLVLMAELMLGHTAYNIRARMVCHVSNTHKCSYERRMNSVKMTRNPKIQKRNPNPQTQTECAFDIFLPVHTFMKLQRKEIHKAQKQQIKDSEIYHIWNRRMDCKTQIKDLEKDKELLQQNLMQIQIKLRGLHEQLLLMEQSEQNIEMNKHNEDSDEENTESYYSDDSDDSDSLVNSVSRLCET